MAYSVLCHKCGLIFLNPRMTQEEYVNFYTSDFYRLLYEGKNFLEACKKKYTLKTAQHIFDEINKIKPINSKTTVLEFGAGGGWNLLPFIKAGAKCIGVDYSPELVKLGNEHGIRMIQGDIRSLKGTYDVIILNHVLEHFLNPIDSLKSIVQHLRKDGIIYIAVPNIENFALEQIQIPHTYYFTPLTFVYYCSIAGLECLKTGPAERIHMFGIYRISEETNCPDRLRKIYGLDQHYNVIIKIIRKAKIKQYGKEILKYIKIYTILYKIKKSFK